MVTFIRTLDIPDTEAGKQVGCSPLLLQGPAPQQEHIKKKSWNVNEARSPAIEWEVCVHGFGIEGKKHQLNHRGGDAADKDNGWKVHWQHHESTLGVQHDERRDLVHRPKPLQVVICQQNHHLSTEEQEHGKVRDSIFLEAGVRLVDAHLVHTASNVHDQHPKRSRAKDDRDRDSDIGTR